jgi:hypothetical protein
VFNKILIANRGEIACRVAATARRLGVRTVAVYSDADAQARHVQACDEAVHIGGRAADSYLRWRPHPRRGRATGAQAVHPGYGFLSENEAFAAPARGGHRLHRPAGGHRAMGSKSAAKSLMEKAGVPLVPGYHGEDQDPALLAREADAHRLPGADQGQRRRRRQGHAPGRPRRRLRRRAGVVQARGQSAASATTTCWSSATCSGRATSRSRCSATPTASASTCSSATARCSGATRR